MTERSGQFDQMGCFISRTDPIGAAFRDGDTLQNLAEQFRKYEATLSERFPAAIADAKTLSGKIVNPETADPDAVWLALWDKPLYANARVPSADTWKARIAPHMEGAWKNWGDPEIFSVIKTGPGTLVSSYKATGPEAEAILQTAIALFRLHRIQGAATALRSRTTVSETPMRDVAVMPLDRAVNLLRAEFGTGWGPITVFHFLTDLGLAIKPDLHLTKTMRHLTGQQGAGKVASFEEAMEFNRLVQDLPRQLGLEPSRETVRYIDKVLMEISLRGLIETEVA